MIKITALLLCTAFGLATLATSGSAAKTSTKTRTVKVGDNYFVKDGKRRTISVTRRTRVRWKWVGDSPHNVRVSRGPVKFRSKTMTKGTYSKLMTRKGTYRIYCSIHGSRDQSMILRVK